MITLGQPLTLAICAAQALLQIEVARVYPEHRIISDVGSGINFKRKGLCRLLELACKGHISEVVVAYRDRLCRFAFELIERVLQMHQVRLVVLNESLDGSQQSELVEDLLAIINVFSCRVNGRRKYKLRGQEADQRPEEVGQAAGERDQEGAAVP